MSSGLCDISFIDHEFFMQAAKLLLQVSVEISRLRQFLFMTQKLSGKWLTHGIPDKVKFIMLKTIYVWKMLNFLENMGTTA